MDLADIFTRAGYIYGGAFNAAQTKKENEKTTQAVKATPHIK
jgi:hypothetical protein